MTMVAKSAPRRLYSRRPYGLVLCFAGKYFAPKVGETTRLTVDDQVTVEVLAKTGKVCRIQVTQVTEEGGKKAVQETWTQKTVEFKTRAAAEKKSA